MKKYKFLFETLPFGNHRIILRSNKGQKCNFLPLYTFDCTIPLVQ